MKTNEQRIYNLEKAVQAIQQDAYGAQAPDNIVPQPPAETEILPPVMPGNELPPKEPILPPPVPGDETIPTPHAAIVKPFARNMVNGREV